MTTPGIEPSQQEKETAGVSPVAKKKSHLGKILAGAAAATAVVAALSLSQCDGDEPQQNDTGATAASSPLDRNGLYYLVLEQGQIRQNPQSDFVPNRYIQQGSCVEGMRDAQGLQQYGKLQYRVRMTEENGNVSEGYIHVGNLSRVAPSDLRSCVAAFKNQNTPRAEVIDAVQTFTTATTINIRSMPDVESEIWGTLNANSCVYTTGDRQNNMMQVGLITDQSSPSAAAFKWVRIRDMQESNLTKDQCRSNYAVGAQAGVTPNPWRP